MKSAFIKAIVGTFVCASYAVAQNCPPAPRNLRSNDFFQWCKDQGGTVEQRVGGQPGDLICRCPVKPPAPIAPQVALWVGLPTLTAGLAAGAQAMSEASQTPEEAISGASEGKDSKIGEAAVTGALVGLGIAAVAYTAVKVGKFQPGPVTRNTPWWRRARISSGVDRTGATRVGLTW